MGATTGQAVTALARRMAADGLLTQLPAGHAPDARAYGKRKSATKGAFIVDARVVNRMSAPPMEHLHLPSLEQLGATMSLMRHLQLRVHFTELDISNMFYTCHTPQGCDSGIRVQIGDDVYGFPGLPFRWAHSPALAQELRGMYLSVQHPRDVVAIQYLDDVLMFSTDRGQLQKDSQDLAQSLERAPWIASPKSELTPTPEIQWMGKRINGTDYTISPEAEYMASLLVGLVALLTKGYRQQRLRRLLGRVL